MLVQRFARTTYPLTMTGAPRKAASPWLITAWALVAVALMWLGLPWRLNLYDEGLILTGALRVMSGEVIHRDFYANYGPGQYHLLALLFDLAGASVGLARLYDVAVRCLILGLGWLLLRSVLRPRPSACVLFALAVWLASWGSPLYPVWSAMALMMAAAYCALAAGRPPAHTRWRRLWWICAGLCTGAIAWFRYDVAVFVGLALCLFQGLMCWANHARSGCNGLRTSSLDLLWLMAGVACAVLPLGWYLQSHGALADFYDQVVHLPRLHYVATRSLPFPPPWRVYELSVYVPLGIAVLALMLVVRDRAALGEDPSAPPTEAVRAAMLFAVLAICLFPKGWVRTSSLHMALAIAPSLLFLGVASTLPAVFGGPSFGVWRRRCLTACLVVAGLATTAAMINVCKAMLANGRLMMQDALGNQSVLAGPRRLSEVTGAALDRFIPIDTHAAAAARWIRQVTSMEEPIFVGTGRHDKVFINDVSFYFVTRRLPVTKWHHYDPGVQTSRAVQQQMIHALESHQVRWIVRDTEWDDVRERNASAYSSGVFDLDTYLSAHYVPIRHFGPYSVWVRRGAVDPALDTR